MSSLALEFVGWLVLVTGAWQLPADYFTITVLGAVIITAARHAR